MKLLFHVHTNNSFDSLLKPKRIIDYAVKNGVGALAITDHETIQGSVEAANYVLLHNLSIKIIIGAEYFSSCGDIIGLFLKQEINEQNAEKLIDEIHRQGGIAVLPHPFKSHSLTTEILQKIDVIETFNSRCSIEQNSKAKDLAIKYNKPSLSGNDAHLGTELALCHNLLIDGSLYDAILSNKSVHTEYTSKVNIVKSQIIKGYKKRDIVLIFKMVKSLLSIYIIQPLYLFLKIKNKWF